MTLRLRRFYLLAVWMPLILPCIVAAGFALQGGGNYVGALAGIGFFLLFSLSTTGIPYAVAALWATRWICAPLREEREVRRLMWRAPLIVAAVALPVWTVLLGLHDGFFAGLSEGVLFYGPYLLVLGYLYVGATAIARAMLNRGGCFTDVRVSTTL